METKTDWTNAPEIQRAMKLRIEAYRMEQGAEKLKA